MWRIILSLSFGSLLWGCDSPTHYPSKEIAIRVATAYCERNTGIEWVQGTYKRDTYYARFRCKNGLQSDWSEMIDKPERELALK